MGVAKKVVEAVKKVAAKKEEVKEETIVSDVCTNCENSGRECNVCLHGKDVV